MAGERALGVLRRCEVTGSGSSGVEGVEEAGVLAVEGAGNRSVTLGTVQAQTGADGLAFGALAVRPHSSRH